MRSKIVRLVRFSGENATLYTVLNEKADGSVISKLDEFLERYKDVHTEETLDIVRRLKSMANETGCTEHFFKLDEGLEYDDLVCALYDVPDINLRLYCIRVSDEITILGDGGPKTTRTWQEDAHLSREVHAMMDVSRVLRTKLDNGDIRISLDKLKLEGDLWISRTTGGQNTNESKKDHDEQSEDKQSGE